MSTHPNAMLQLVLTPLDPSFDAFQYFGWQQPEDNEDNDPDLNFELRIGERDYTATVFTEDGDDYNEHWQINGEAGQVIIHDYITYGYGETITFKALVDRANELMEWAVKHHEAFSYTLRVGANYW